MNVGGPTCGACGGLNTNPQSPQCRFCGQMLQQPQAYGAPAGYGAAPVPPQGYGPPPMGGYGAPMQQQGYAPNPYGGPAPNPYAQQYPVQGFGGVQPFQGGNGYVVRSSWSSGWSTFFWIRLGIAAIVIFTSLIGACISAVAGH